MEYFRRGFSLIEVLIGITILIMGFIPVYMLIFNGEKSSIETVQNVKALMYCHTLLEEIKTLPISDIPVTDKISDLDFFKLLGKNVDKKLLLNKDVESKSELFKGFVEVIDETDCKRIKVYVRNKNISRSSGGKRGETTLECLVLW